MDNETGTEIDRQGEEDKEKHRHGDRDWGQGQIYRQTWTEGQGQKYGKGQRELRDRGTGMEGQGWKARNRGTEKRTEKHG